MNKKNIHPGVTFGIAIVAFVVYYLQSTTVIGEAAGFLAFLFLILGIVGSMESGIRDRNDK